MRDLFPEFNKPSSDEFKKLWTEAIFVFDTNVLLSLYRLSQRPRKKLLSILEELKERVWIPHQVAKEYYRRRFEVIYEQERKYRKVIESLKKREEDIKNQLDEYSRHPFIDCKKILKKISSNHKAIYDEIEKAKSKHPDWTHKDTIEPELNKIFKGKVGSSYDPKRLNEIFGKGEDRYEKEIPPGYKDKDKDKNDKTGISKYGDLLIWHQIIDKAKESKKPLIFITDDQKEDWWWEVSGSTIGARHELIKEIKDQASIMFHMYQSNQFISHAKDHLSIALDPELVDQLKKLMERKGKELLVKASESLALSNESEFLKGDIKDTANDLSANTSDVKNVESNEAG